MLSRTCYMFSHVNAYEMHTYAIDLPNILSPLMHSIPNTKDIDAYLVVKGDLLPPRR